MQSQIKTVAAVLAIGLAASIHACSTQPGPTAQQAPTPDPGADPGAATAHALATQISGAPEADAAVATDALSLQFGVAAGDAAADLASLGLALDGFLCRFGDTPEFAPCSGAPFTISGLRDGEEYRLSVKAILRNLETGEITYAAEAVTTFHVVLGAPSTPGQEAPDRVRTLANSLQVGSAYEVDVPEGMHVTEFSSSKTTGVLSFFRIMPDSDAYYLNNYTCDRSWDRVIGSVAPAGQPLMYCHSTPTRRAYKEDNEFRLAHNHIELTTDANLVESDNQERLSVAIYDADFEFMNARSRFRNACQNSKIDYITVPMLNNFFLGKNPEQVNFWYCDTYQQDINGARVLWRVGAFLDIDHMDWACDDCRYDRAVEAVYMVRANRDVFLPETFARQAQERILGVLHKLTP